jgi:hypothetical protein
MIRIIKLACGAMLLSGATGCYADFDYGYDTPGYAATVDGTGYYGGVATDDYPPAAYIATATPYYYEGRAAYYYNNRWYYRDGARWNYYRSEPSVLGQYRTQYYGGARYAPQQRIYGGGGFGGHYGGDFRGGYGGARGGYSNSSRGGFSGGHGGGGGRHR